MKEELLEDLLLEEKVKLLNEIILHNDDVNSFDYVIELLIKYCQHSPIQAEQCAYLTHYNGKCSIKQGELYKLKPISETLNERGLSTEIV